jgi:hypothetical protein
MAKTTERRDELSTEEGLALFRAFREIKTAPDRRQVIELAERLAGTSPTPPDNPR